MTNGISLTNRRMTAVKGQPAYLPNQPIIHNCIVDPTLAANTYLSPGDVVALQSAATLKGVTVVKKAAVTDTPCGVVVFNSIKSGFAANDKISIFPVNSFVYLPAGAANIKLGDKLQFNASGQVVTTATDKLQFNASGQVVTTATASNGYIGIAWTAPSAVNDLIVVQIVPGMEAAASS